MSFYIIRWSILLSMQEVNVNLIITDYCMPGMTGYDLLTRVKVNPQTETPRNMYFIFVISLIVYSSIVCNVSFSPTD